MDLGSRGLGFGIERLGLSDPSGYSLLPSGTLQIGLSG